SGWLGFDRDKELCAKIEEETGIPATSSMLAQIEAFKEDNVKTVNLVTPYIKEINDLIVEQYKNYCGIDVINVEGCGQTVNRSFSLVDSDRVEEMVKSVASSPADGISVVCTNFPAVYNVEYLEETYDQTFYDSIAVVVWQAMRMVGVDPHKVK